MLRKKKYLSLRGRLDFRSQAIYNPSTKRYVLWANTAGCVKATCPNGTCASYAMGTATVRYGVRSDVYPGAVWQHGGVPSMHPPYRIARSVRGSGRHPLLPKRALIVVCSSPFLFSLSLSLRLFEGGGSRCWD